MIPFTHSYISKEAIDSVIDVLQSGWITTGPVTKNFEQKITEYCNNKKTLCVNSATAGLELVLRWFGVDKDDEVIIPAYTYCATANVVVHCGAKIVMVDSEIDNANISIERIRKAITNKTKVIIPVDLFGFPCNYSEIDKLVNDDSIRKMFVPKNQNQEKLNRILVLSDAAHSLGATYFGKKTGVLSDIAVFSFHAVKNLTTSEGGAIALNLPEPFDNENVYKTLSLSSLHGQSKDALSKITERDWRYDVTEAGYKMNMTDIQAALGLAQLIEYNDILQKRKFIFDSYTNALKKYNWAELPIYETKNKCSSFHVYNLKIKNVSEQIRDKIINTIFENKVSVNVHFQPLPMLSYYIKNGYNISDYPNAYQHYSREISLPVFFSMTDKQIAKVIEVVAFSVQKHINA